MSKGFTLIELLVVTGVIALFSVAILPNYNSGSKDLAMQRAAHKVAQDLRRAQEMAISSQEIAGSIPDGVGLFFYLGWTNYRMFADRDNDHVRDSNEEFETIQFEPSVKVYSLYYNSTATLTLPVLFEPPDPNVWIKGLSSGTVAKITLSLTGDTNVRKDIFVNNTGLIYIGD